MNPRTEDHNSSKSGERPPESTPTSAAGTSAAATAPALEPRFDLFTGIEAMTEDQFADFCATYAFTGHGTQQIRNELAERLDEKQKRYNAYASAKLARLRASEQSISDQLASVQTELEECRLDIASLTEEIADEQSLTQQIKTEQDVIAAEIRQERLKFEEQAFRDHSDFLHNATESVTERIRNDIQHAAELRDQLAAAGKADKDENERRAKYYREAANSAAEQLNIVSRLLDALQSVGFSFHVTTVLYATGVTWCVGNAILLAILFSKLGIASAATDLVAAVLTPFHYWIVATGFFWALLIVIAGLFGFLLFLLGIIMIADLWLRAYDPSWSAEPKKQQSGFGLATFFAVLRNLIKPEDPLKGDSEDRQIPLTFTRRSHVQIVAAYVWLVLFGVLAFFAAAVYNPAAKATGGVEPFYFYLGALWSSVSAGAGVLYVCAVVRSRLVSLSQSIADGSTASVQTAVRVHWECVVLLALLLATAPLVAYGVNGGKVPVQWLLAPLSLSVGLGSLIFGYAVVHKGYFRQQRYLQHRYELMSAFVDKFMSQPTVDDFFNRAFARRLRDMSGDFTFTRHKVEELRLLNKLRRTYEPEFEPDVLKKLLDHVCGRLKIDFFPKLRFGRRQPPDTEFILCNIPVERDLIRRHTEAVGQLRACQFRMEEAARRRTAAEEQLGKLASTADDLRKQRLRLQTEQDEAKQQEQSQLQSLSDRFARLRFILMNAEAIANHTAGNSAPPPPPPAGPTIHEPPTTRPN